MKVIESTTMPHYIDNVFFVFKVKGRNHFVLYFIMLHHILLVFHKKKKKEIGVCGCKVTNWDKIVLLLT